MCASCWWKSYAPFYGMTLTQFMECVPAGFSFPLSEQKECNQCADVKIITEWLKPLCGIFHAAVFTVRTRITHYCAGESACKVCLRTICKANWIKCAQPNQSENHVLKSNMDMDFHMFFSAGDVLMLCLEQRLIGITCFSSSIVLSKTSVHMCSNKISIQILKLDEDERFTYWPIIQDTDTIWWKTFLGKKMQQQNRA